MEIATAIIAKELPRRPQLENSIDEALWELCLKSWEFIPESRITAGEAYNKLLLIETKTKEKERIKEAQNELVSGVSMGCVRNNPESHKIICRKDIKYSSYSWMSEAEILLKGEDGKGSTKRVALKNLKLKLEGSPESEQTPLIKASFLLRLNSISPNQELFKGTEKSS